MKGIIVKTISVIFILNIFTNTSYFVYAANDQYKSAFSLKDNSASVTSSRLYIPLSSGLTLLKQTNSATSSENPGSSLGTKQQTTIIKDYLSSTRVLVEGGGETLRTLAYYPYGQSHETWIMNHGSSTTQNSNNPKTAIQTQSGSAISEADQISAIRSEAKDQITDNRQLTTDKLFTSHRKLDGLSVYHAGSRFYNPTLGLFIQPDKVEGINRYAYVVNNPVMFTDPSGNMKVMDAEGGAGTSVSSPTFRLQQPPRKEFTYKDLIGIGDFPVYKTTPCSNDINSCMIGKIDAWSGGMFSFFTMGNQALSPIVQSSHQYARQWEAELGFMIQNTFLALTAAGVAGDYAAIKAARLGHENFNLVTKEPTSGQINALIENYVAEQWANYQGYYPKVKLTRFKPGGLEGHCWQCSKAGEIFARENFPDLEVGSIGVSRLANTGDGLTLDLFHTFQVARVKSTGQAFIVDQTFSQFVTDTMVTHNWPKADPLIKQLMTTGYFELTPDNLGRYMSFLNGIDHGPIPLSRIYSIMYPIDVMTVEQLQAVIATSPLK